MVSIGEIVAFHCMCPDNITTINWIFNDKEINISTTRYNTTSDTLTILEVRSSDSGNYTCDSNSEDNVSLTVEGKYLQLICINIIINL